MALSLRCRNCGWVRIVQERSPDHLRLCPRCTSVLHYVDESGNTYVYLAIFAMVGLVILAVACTPLACILAAALSRHH